jgi:serine O-acetyltransferase
MIGNLTADLKADFVRHDRSLRELGVWVAGVYHFGVWASARPPGAGRWLASRLYGLSSLLVELGTGCHIDRTTRVGVGLHVVHAQGVRVHPEAVIGERCGIMNDVTIGTTRGTPGAPTIGDDVFIGAGAKILGPVTVGNGATVAANTLVITDVPPGATVIGVPGRVLPGPRAGSGGRPNGGNVDQRRPAPLDGPHPGPQHLAAGDQPQATGGGPAAGKERGQEIDR